MRLALPSIALVFAPILAGCGGGDDTTTAGNTAPNYEIARFDTGTFTVPPGDSFACFYLDATTAEDMAVIGATGDQAEGEHHLLAYSGWNGRTAAGKSNCRRPAKVVVVGHLGLRDAQKCAVNLVALAYLGQRLGTSSGVGSSVLAIA